MHPEQIKAELRMKGITPSALADDLGVSKSALTGVIAGYGKSARIQSAIADVIKKPINEIWPNPRPRLQRTRAEIEAARAARVRRVT